MKKNSLSLFAVLIVLLGLFLFYNVRSVRDDARRFVEMELINELSQLSVDIESWIGGEMRVLEVMREIIKHVPKEELIAQAQYNPFLVMRDDELDPYIGLADGTTLDNRDRFTGVAYDPRERIWYQKALE
ncbi:MAG: hypothetical protein JXO44_06985, partial [Clostridia bacterium]|nr:hypothetical protein [Clostridia bacterium]